MKSTLRRAALLSALALTPAAMFTTLRSQSKGEAAPAAYRQVNDADQLNVPVADFRTLRSAALKNTPQRRLRGRHYGLKTAVSPVAAVKFKLSEEGPEATFAGVSDHAPPEEALPVAGSDFVVIGRVTDAQAYVSEDETELYSEFSLRVESVLKGNDVPPGSGSGTITATRAGGGLKFPSGKVIKRGTAGRTMPVVGSRYLLFLRYDSEAQFFPIVTGYELKAGRVRPLDGAPAYAGPGHPFAAYAKYNNADEAALLNEVRAAIGEPRRREARHWDGSGWREQQ